MGRHDATFAEICAYGSDRWCALKLGRSYEWFRRTRPELERKGFPPKDTITGYTIKADVDAWIAKRRRYSDAGGPHNISADHHNITNGERLDRL